MFYIILLFIAGLSIGALIQNRIDIYLVKKAILSRIKAFESASEKMEKRLEESFFPNPDTTYTQLQNNHAPKPGAL